MVKNKTFSEKPRERLEDNRNTGLPTASGRKNSLHKVNRVNKKSILGSYSKADIEELVHELNSLNHLLNDKRVSELHQFDVKEKSHKQRREASILKEKIHQSKALGWSQSEPQIFNKTLTFNVKSKTRTVVENPKNGQNIRNNAISVLHQLKNGPIETLLKQKGFLFNTSLESKGKPCYIKKQFVVIF
jgi:hypothetical protein